MDLCPAICRRAKLFNMVVIGVTVSLRLFQAPLVEAADSIPTDKLIGESALSVSNRISEEISSLREQISFLESEYGPYHQALLTPLRELTHLQVELKNFQGAERLLERRLQIHRIVDGPSNLTQLDTIFDLISNEIREQQWQSVTDQYEFIQWLVYNNANANVEQKLDLLSDAASWHVAAIHLDTNENRMLHLTEYEKTIDSIVTLAEAEYGQESPQLVPLLYKKAMERYLQFTFTQATDELYAQHREHQGESGPYSTNRSLASLRKCYLSNSHTLLKEIRDIVETTDDPETLGMAMVDEAACFRLYKPRAPVSRLYLEARRKLVESGVSEKKIDTFFAQPTIIPVAEIYLSINSALAGQETFDQKMNTSEKEAESVRISEFIALESSLLISRRRDASRIIADAEQDLNSVLLQLEVRRDGFVGSIKVLGSTPDETRVRRHGVDAAKLLTFRLNPINRWWSAKRTTTLLYRYPD